MKRRRIIYEPPPREFIEQFSRDVCEALAQQGDASFENPEVVAGLADFLYLLATIIARKLNDAPPDFVDKTYS